MFDVELEGPSLPWGVAIRRDAAEPEVVIVASVAPGSQAARLDLRPGDRILGRSSLLIEREGRLRSLELPRPE